jgi:hypothetical protein
MRPRIAPLPPEEAKRYASVVWKDDFRLPKLLTELAENQHSGPVEKAFKEYLLAKAGENFDEAVTRKGTHIMPDLFLSPRVYFLDKGDMQSAKKRIPVGAR